MDGHADRAVTTAPVYYYRRSIEHRVGVAQSVVYSVRPVAGMKPDPVPVIAGFPENWRPTENPGQCLFERGVPLQVYETLVPRSQFRHYGRITEAEALALYSDLRT